MSPKRPASLFGKDMPNISDALLKEVGQILDELCAKPPTPDSTAQLLSELLREKARKEGVVIGGGNSGAPAAPRAPRRK